MAAVDKVVARVHLDVQWVNHWVCLEHRFSLILSLLLHGQLDGDLVLDSALVRLLSRILFVKGNDCERLILAIDAKEVEERNGALKRGLSDERDFLAGLEESASHVQVDDELNFGHIDLVVPHLDHLVLYSLHKFRLVLIASKFTPKLFEVDSADGDVGAENAVDLLERMLHDFHLVVSAAQRFRSVNVRAHAVQYGNRENLKWNGLPLSNDRI